MLVKDKVSSLIKRLQNANLQASSRSSFLQCTLQSSVDIRNYSQCVMEFEFLQDTLREFPSPNHFQPQSGTKEALPLRIANMKTRISNGARVTANFATQKVRVK